jgi:hypothetical protein
VCRGHSVEGYYDWALVYPSQGGRYRAEGCWQWGSDSSVRRARLHNVVCRPSVRVGLRGRWPNVSHCQLGTLRDMKELINHSLWKRSISPPRGPRWGTMEGGGRSFTGDFERKVRPCVMGAPGDM